MKKIILICFIVFLSQTLFAQDGEETKEKKFKIETENNLQLGVSSYYRRYYKGARIRPFSNKGALLAFENRTMIRPWVYLTSTLEADYWNNSVIGPYYSPVKGIVNDTVKFLHSINNFGLNLKVAFSFPVEFNQFKLLVGLGLKWRSHLNSKATAFDMNEQELETNGGYIKDKIRHNDSDHLAVVLHFKKLKDWELKLEADHLISTYFYRLGSRFHHGYYYRATDGLYEYYNLNFKLCYKI